MGRIDKIPRGSFLSGPVLNRNRGLFDQLRACFSGMPVGPDMDANYSMHRDDFVGKALDTTNDWSTLLDAAAAAALLADQENGVLKITSAATTNDNGGVVFAANKCFLVKSGLPLWFFARVQVSVAATTSMFVGLGDAVATAAHNAYGTTQKRVGFQLSGGSAQIKCVTNDGTTDTLTGATQKAKSGGTAINMADATWVDLAFRVEGGSVLYYVNRELAAINAIPSGLAAVQLGLQFAEVSGDTTGTHSGQCDLLQAVKLRVARSASVGN